MNDSSSSQSAAKRKSKKRRKGKGSKGASGVADGATTDQSNKMPKQVAEKDDQVITTTKCNRCKGTFRQMILPNDNSLPLIQSEIWMCPSCVQEAKSEETKLLVNSAHSALTSHTMAMKDSLSVLGASGCNCNACVAKRENAVSPEVERDAHITQAYWMEIRHVVRCIYRENMSLTSQSNRASIGSDKMRMIVKKLCSRDPHQFFQRLETLAREYLLEVKVRLLEQLSCGFNSPQLAIEFIQMLLEEYSMLCNALPALLYLLKPLEDCEYVQKLGMTIELMNKNIFRELIFAESFMSSNLPLIIAQLRLASLADHYHRTAAEELSQRYMALDQEMEEISQIWKSAKDHLNNQQLEERQSHFEKIKADGESFKQKLQHSSKLKDGEEAAEPGNPGCESHSSAHHDSVATSENFGKSHSTNEAILNSTNKQYSDCNGILNPGTSIPVLLQSHLNENGHAVRFEQAEKWANVLVKCIKPMGEPEFSLNGDVATHTIILHLDLTRIDLAESKPYCSHGDLVKYRHLGLTVEEIVEVAMKLSSLRNLGISLTIEDLFDDEGFSLSDINETVVGVRTGAQAGDIYFLDSDEPLDVLTGHHLLVNGDVDLQKVKESILQRQEGNGHPVSSSSSLLNGAKTRQHDFLQGMTLKIRFVKILTVEELDKHLVADDAKVVFGSCDQVQMKLTQLELSSVRLITSSDPVGDNLGLDNDSNHLGVPPMNPLSTNRKTPEDYVFVHTDSHREFMDLLLDKRKKLEDTLYSKEEERRNLQITLGESSKETAKAKEKENTQGTSNLPRYQVQEQQESAHSPPPPLKLTTETHSRETQQKKEQIKAHFKPLYYSRDSQPCHCSACVGAMATIITPSYHQTLTASDPPVDSAAIECSLSTHLGVDSTASPLSKEGLWQNWMSTSGSAQLENESHIANGHHHHTAGAHHHCHFGETCEADSERPKTCEHLEADPSASASGYINHSAIGMCSNHHAGQSACVAADGCVNENGSASGAHTSAVGEIPRRYCPCCYCELFGHNGPPTAPTSQNYTKRRDIMRQKLEEKKKKRREHGSKSERNFGKDDEQQTSVEELLAFIEGGEGEETEQALTSKNSKKQKKKKKLQMPSLQLQMSSLLASGEEDLNANMMKPAGHYLFHHLHQESLEECEEEAQEESNKKHKGDNCISDPRVHITRDNFIQRKEALDHMSNGSGSRDRDPKESIEINGDEYDDELEKFKEFCFADAPVGPRKKIAVSLNMHDIMSKLSN